MSKYDRDTLTRLRDGNLPFEEVHRIQSAHKDRARFREMLAIAQSSVSWTDQILLPYAEHLYIVEKEDGRRIVKCDCGHEFGSYTDNWKLEARIRIRNTEEDIAEIYPRMMGCDPDWMNLREYICPDCATLLEIEAVPPGYPIVFDFQPDLDGFYAQWESAEQAS